ncbi:MAG: ATP-dependent zinc protease [Desulfuromonadaceae bacterium]|nr:ATP-dependent zinc protease [Desulfuromonadaceae bacterium]
MKRLLQILVVTTGVVLLMLSSGCRSHFVVATQADGERFDTLMEREERQLNQLQQLTSQIEDMHSVLLEGQNINVLNLQERVETQEKELRALQRALDELRQNKEPALVQFNDARSRVVVSHPKPASTNDTTARPVGKQVIGAVEKVYISPPGIILPARIDTGAATSSIDARKIETFERNGDPWVRFFIQNPENGEKTELERKVVRKVRIIQSISEEEKDRRPVVELLVTLGNTMRTAEFTLTDRSHMEFPVLIGRNILMDSMTVDISKKYISTPIPSSP